MSTKQNSILMEVPPREKDLGDGVIVKRLLPYAKKRLVGPFIFLDHMGPAVVDAEKAFDVRPHPHIGLSTLSYLYEGKVHHRDSLGSDQTLLPRDVNWMTAGRGIVHSERTPDELRGTSFRMELLQFWIALPKHAEDVEPRFSHHPSSEIPVFQHEGSQVTLIAGEAFGKKSPVDVYSKLFFFEVLSTSGDSFSYSSNNQETALYLLKGEIEITGKTFSSGDFLIFEQGSDIHFTATKDSKMVMFGGEPLTEDRHIYWNFVSSSQEKIEQAKILWKAQGFPQVPGETEFIPLPKE